MQRAYSVLNIKSVDDDARVIEGIASTPSTDRQGDIVEPMGAEFALPIPLLWQHRSAEPIGEVFFAKPTKDGIPFKARIPKISEPGRLKDRIDEAWQSVKARLVRGTSVGFSPIEDADIKGSFGKRFIRWEWLELSLVTIPANMEATINTIKQFDTDQPAPTGTATRVLKSPGATGPVKAITHKPGALPVKTVSESIKEFEATRQAKSARMDELMAKSSETGSTLDDAQSEEFDTLEGEVSAIDKHLVRLHAQEERNKQTAKPVNGKNTDDAANSRTINVVKGTPSAPPGIRFARVIKCMGIAARKNRDVESVAKEMYPDDGLIQKAAVAAGTTLSGSWAEDLVGETSAVFADFVDFLRPQTILGKFGTDGRPGLRSVPFRVPLVTQTGGGDGYWVGEGKAKPLTSFDWTRRTLEPLKVANIAVLTEEVLRSSSPSAETLVRDSLAAALRERLDIDFIDPAKAASAGVSPASITNGVSAIPSSGNDAAAIRADIQALFAAFIADNNAPTSGVWIMPSTRALAVAMMQNPLGQQEFPGISMNGGTLFGLPVIVSEYVPTDSDGSIVILANASDIYLADEGGISVDVSREASLEMRDDPAHNSGTPTAATVNGLVSLWQTNSVGFRAERSINWLKRRAGSVQLLEAVQWGA